MKKKIIAKIMVCSLLTALCLNHPANSIAAKKPVLSKTKFTISVGATKKLTLRKTSAKKIKSTIWKASNKKIKLSKKNKTSVVIAAKKAGKSTITAKVKLKTKASIRLTCQVTVKENKNENKNTNTTTPDTSSGSSTTPIPGTSSGPAATPEPAVTPGPAVTPEPTATPVPTATPLKELASHFFKMGAAINGSGANTAAIKHEGMANILKTEFNSTTCSNLMKPVNMLDKAATLEASDGLPRINLAMADESLKFCQDNGIGMRGHVLIWHNQTPKWFFCQDYDDTKDYVSADVMATRMESYIKQVLEYCQTNYPGVIYCWDVVNECIDDGASADTSNGWGIRKTYNGDDNYWYATMGKDYVYKAYEYARKYAAPGVSLMYNDYNVFMVNKRNNIICLLNDLKERGLIDGVGLQPTVTLTFPSQLSGTTTDDSFENCLLAYAETGLEIQITELSFEIPKDSDGMPKVTEANLAKQASRYGEMMKLLLRMDSDNGGPCNITAVTVFGICDDYPLYENCNQNLYLYDKDCNPKACYYSYRKALEDFIASKNK